MTHLLTVFVILISCDDVPPEGGSQDVSQICLDYLDCVREGAPADVELFEAAVGSDSECWDDPAAAGQCSATCVQGISDQLRLTPDAAACWSEGPPGPDEFFEVVPRDYVVTEAPDCVLFEGMSASFGSISGPSFAFRLYDEVGTDDYGCDFSGAPLAFTCIHDQLGVEATGRFDPVDDAVEMELQLLGETERCPLALGAVTSGR